MAPHAFFAVTKCNHETTKTDFHCDPKQKGRRVRLGTGRPLDDATFSIFELALAHAVSDTAGPLLASALLLEQSLRLFNRGELHEPCSIA